jgi:hypothetical protein
MRSVQLLGLSVIVILAIIGMAQAAFADAFGDHESIGCEANPTGNPIGGGDGYDDIYETGDFIVGNLTELLAALKEARPGQVIFVPHGIEIDVSGRPTLVLPAGVTLAGTRGKDGSPGARIFTTTFPGMFAVGGNDTRFTGLRFEGPYAGAERIAGLARFLSINHCNNTVDNCEIYNFNSIAIGVGTGALNTHVHHNYIHHCQLTGGGYGVAADGGSDVRIIANKFDYCRHHLKSSGVPGSGYEGAWNLIMEHANGTHCDMHGGRDRGDGTDIAGDWMHIHHNTFLSPLTHVGIRGTPSDGAEIHNNWFARPAEDSVRSTGNTRVYNNVWGPDRIPQEHAIHFVDGKSVECAVEQCPYCP